jgi:hypothetical protein
MTTKCEPHSDTDRCVYCGKRCRFWRNGKRPPRNCTNPPSLRPAADTLCLPNPIPKGMAQHLAVWLSQGDTPPEEMAARDAICVMCDAKRPLGTPVFNDVDKCNSIAKGCGGSGYRPPLCVMQRLPSFRCPASKWPGN